MNGPLVLGWVLGATSPSYFCNYAKIAASGHRVAVHATHHDRSRTVARLAPGTVVYICDDFRNDDLSNRWVQTSFADASHPCSGSTKGLELNYASRCRRGWVRERYVEILSG